MSALVRDVAWVGDFIHPRGSKERLTLVLRAYLDGGGKYQDEKTPVVAVAGFVAGERLWTAWEARWGAFLAEFELENFHAAPFWSRKIRPYSRWDDARHAAAVERLCSIFEDICPFGIGWAVDKKVFEEWRRGVGFFVDEDPYYYCLSLCLRALIHGIAEEPKDEGIAIYIDEDKEHESLSRQFAKWHESRLRQSPPKKISKDRTVSTHYVSRIDFKPLQAADILVHASYQSLRDFLKVCETAPKIAPPPETLAYKKPYFLERMEAAGAPIRVNEFHMLEHFNIIAKKWAGSSGGRCS